MRWSITDDTVSTRLPAAAGIVGAVLVAGAMLATSFPVNVALVPAAAVGIAMVLVPWLGPLFLTLSIPVQEAVVVHAGGALTATKLALVGAVIAFLIQFVSRRERLRGSILIVPFLLYLVAMVISIRAAVSVGDSLAELYRWVVPLFALILTLYAVRSRRAVTALAIAMAVGVMVEAALGLGQSLTGFGPASFAVSRSISRAYGTFGKPNTYAAYFELSGPLIAALAVWSLSRSIKLFRAYRTARLDGMVHSAASRQALVKSALVTGCLGFASVLGLAAIGMSFSRGAWMGTAAAVLVMLLLTGRRAPLVAASLIILLGVVMAAGGVDYAPAVIRERYDQLVSQIRFFDSRDVLVTDENFAAVERMAHWQTGLAMFMKHPITGVGIGNFNDRFTEFAVNPAFVESRGHAHNYYIQALAETGLIGLTAYLLMLGTAMLICLRCARWAPTSLGRALGVGATGVTVALMVHNIVEDLHVLNLGVQLSVVWALAIIGSHSLSQDAGTRPDRKLELNG